MRLPRQRYYIASLAVMLSVGFSGALTTTTNALSLGDVTNALGNVLGLNAKNATETSSAPVKNTTDQQAQIAQAPTSAQPAQSPTAPLQSAPATSQSPAVSTASNPTAMSAAPVTQVEQVTPSTRDTGAIVQQVASAQTAKPIAPVAYSSSKISTELRDELFAVAAVITIVGAATYALTYTTSSQSVPAVSRRPLYIK